MVEAKQLRLGGSVLGRHRHVCAFFRNKDEEYRVLLPFIKEGLDEGDRAVHIMDSVHCAQHRQRLKGAGIDIAVAEEKDQLEVRSWDDAYLQDGHFDQNRQLALIEKLLAYGNGRGFPLTRLVANMAWALDDRPGVHDIVEYEARLNQILPKYDHAVCCTYDITRFSASVVMDVLRTHPSVIVGGILQENPFYVPPDEFLRELRERQTYVDGGAG
jgi:hypothetical protein